jgi:hypothetical protein
MDRQQATKRPRNPKKSSRAHVWWHPSIHPSPHQQQNPYIILLSSLFYSLEYPLLATLYDTPRLFNSILVGRREGGGRAAELLLEVILPSLFSSSACCSLVGSFRPPSSFFDFFINSILKKEGEEETTTTTIL